MRIVALRRFLRLAALLIVLAVAGAWAGTGAHRGWTKTEVTEMRRDEITGLDYPVTRRGFVAGLDLLAGGACLAALLFGVSFALRRRAGRAAP